MDSLPGSARTCPEIALSAVEILFGFGEHFCDVLKHSH